MKSALLLRGATDLGMADFSADMLWRCRFSAPDPFLLIETEDKKVSLLLFALETARAVKEATADEIISLEDLGKRYRLANSLELLNMFLNGRQITTLIVPQTFPFALGKYLETFFDIKIQHGSAYPERARKSEWEVEEIRKAQQAVEVAVADAKAFLAVCHIRDNFIFNGETIVTSEIVRSIIDTELYRQGYLGVQTIVASGVQAADPHCSGSGPLAAYAPIVMDVFPRSLTSLYFADMTRTFFKGEPDARYQGMYDVVLASQEAGIAAVRAGVTGKDVFDLSFRVLENCGYPTRLESPAEGMFHGLGHGVGIEIHEAPSLSDSSQTALESGNVVTVEPGLYYAHARDHIPQGGIRIEDMVLVTPTGCINLTTFPKDWESMVIP